MSEPTLQARIDAARELAGRRTGDALRAPFVLGDRRRLAAMFREAGAASTSIETARGTARFPSVRVTVEADLRGWLPVMGVMLREPEIERILREAEHALAAFVDPDGAASFEISAHVATAAAPR